MVASANGSPKILPALNLAILLGLGSMNWFSLLKDGELIEYCTMNMVGVPVRYRGGR